MPEKPAWVMAVGDATKKPEDGDSLLAQTKSERERKRLLRQDEIEAAEHETRKAKLEKEKTTAEAAVEKSGEPKEEYKGGFQVVGKFDVNAERDRAQAEVERLRKESADNVTRTAEENSRLREKLHDAEMAQIKATTEASINALIDKIDNRTLGQQLEEIRSTAAELGLKAPDPGVSDPALSIQMLRLNHEEAQRSRQWEFEKIKHQEEMEERREQRRAEAAYNQQKLNQEAKKMEYFAQAPTMIGEAIGAALTQSGGNGAPVTSKRKSKQEYELTVPQGEAGVTSCPGCKAEVGVGATARSAVCANCNTRISIKRVQPEDDAPIEGAESGMEPEFEEEE